MICTPKEMRRDKGFTLVELSIVLIIISLIVSTVLVGQELIKVSNIRKFHQEYEYYVIATSTFLNKYNCIPADCQYATAYFGLDSEGCLPATVNKTPKKETCNGNGNGVIGPAETDEYSTFAVLERYTFWQHLGAAGMIAGIYSGSMYSPQPALRAEQNCPAVLDSNYCWIAGNTVSDYDDLAIINHNQGNILMVRNPVLGELNKFFTAREALQYDSKYDDGNPVKGFALAHNAEYSGPNCTTSQDNSAKYNLNFSTKECALFFRPPF